MQSGCQSRNVIRVPTQLLSALLACPPPVPRGAFAGVSHPSSCCSGNSSCAREPQPRAPGRDRSQHPSAGLAGRVHGGDARGWRGEGWGCLRRGHVRAVPWHTLCQGPSLLFPCWCLRPRAGACREKLPASALTDSPTLPPTTLYLWDSYFLSERSSQQYGMAKGFE